MSHTTEPERQARRREVAKRLRLGESYAEIAEALDVAKSTIANDVKRLRETWREAIERDMEKHLSRRIAELKAIKREAFAAWLDSKENPKRSKVRTEGEGRSAATVGEGGEIEQSAVVTDVERVTKEVTETAGGDPRHLRTMLRAENRIAKLLGVAEVDPPTGGAGRIDALVQAIEQTAREMNPEQYEDDVTGPSESG